MDLNQSSRMPLRALLSALVFAGTLWAYLHSSSLRPLWGDEMNGFIDNFSIASMLKDGAHGQCSPQPLYYILMKIWNSFRALFGSVDNSLVLLRLPSATFASIFLAGLTWCWGLPGLVAAGLMFSQPALWGHATETRPYTLWLLLSFFFHIALGKISLAHRRGLRFLAVAAALLALTSLGALFQILGAMVWAVLFLRKDSVRVIAALLPALGIMIYYMVVPVLDCTNFSGNDGIYTLGGTLAHGDFTLVNAVLRLFVEKSLFTLPLYVLSAFTLFKVWRARGQHREEARVWQYLLPILVSLPIATVGTALAIWYKNYYFIPRMFLFVFAAKGIFLAVSLSWFCLYIERKLRPRR